MRGAPLRLTHYTLTNALGRGVGATREALHTGRSGLRLCDLPGVAFETYIGRVQGLEEVSLPPHLAHYDCRTTRLALLGLEQDDFVVAVGRCRDALGAARVGVFLGTSTSGIGATEAAYCARAAADAPLPATFDYRHTHDAYAATELVRTVLGLTGPALTVSTACSSSAKVFATAYRHIRAGLCDAAVVGGVDTLCLTTLYGFKALELVAQGPCRPWDRARSGISLGEASGFVLLEPGAPQADEALLLGYGESSDAYHIATPHPDGVGAAAAMGAALASAALDSSAIDYVNLHGTGTPTNDAAEDRAVCEVLGVRVPCSSTKGWTGHTLGAAGVTEAVIAALCLQDAHVPASLNTRHPDPALHANILLEGRRMAVHRVLSNSFGFGGSNCCLVLGTAEGC
jgi:3-oxoacyl-[acyl-carrier-protein] synthase-1